jgi:hypothetical protein
MKITKIIGFMAVLALVLTVGGVFGIEITGTAPQASGTAAAAQSEINKAFNTALADLNKEIKDIDDTPEQFIGAFANSSVFSSTSVSQRGYGGYNLVAFTLGPMVGFQVPYELGEIVDIVNDPETILDELQRVGDLGLGFNVQAINGQFMMNTGFLLKGLYLGVKFGYFNLSLPDLGGTVGLNLNNFNVGLMANYQLIKEKSLVGVVKWRGLTLGSGIIYQQSNIDVSLALDDIQAASVSIPGGGSAKVVISDPKAVLGFHTNTVTIPLEASTALRLLFVLNLSLGVGADLAFGESSLEMDAAGDVKLEGVAHTPGTLSASGGGGVAPSVINPKLTAGVGLNLGPVILDIPVTWYFAQKGYSIGVSVGAVL